LALFGRVGEKRGKGKGGGFSGQRLPKAEKDLFCWKRKEVLLHAAKKAVSGEIEGKGFSSLIGVRKKKSARQIAIVELKKKKRKRLRAEEGGKNRFSDVGRKRRIT